MVTKEKIIIQEPNAQSENKKHATGARTFPEINNERYDEPKKLNSKAEITHPKENPEIKRLEVKLDSLLMRYTEKHPSVKTLRRKLDFLKQKQ